MQTEVLDREAHLNSGSVFLVAVEALETLALHPPHQQIIRQRFSVPGKDVEIGLISNEVASWPFAAWGVQRTFEIANSLHYASIRSNMAWHGQQVGVIELIRQAAPRTENSKGAAENVTLMVDDSVPSSRKISTGLQASHNLELVPRLTGSAMPMFDIMLTILKVMVRSIEEGRDKRRDKYFPGIEWPTIVLRPETPFERLTWGHIAKMMRVLGRWMVWRNSPQAVDFLIKRDGEILARGMIRPSPAHK
ncbi:MAG: hypothetical protein LQ337_005955 [Flavoplaca oasis]|nr:MAG: hypothetical protein LQ337_005955 [Flavoplaca oasis]